MVAAITAVAVVGGSLLSSEISSNASEDAAHAQTEASNKSIDSRNAQFAETKKLLQPWITTGVDAASGQRDLIGLGTPDAQKAAIDRLRGGAEFGSLKTVGENAILANASATGGLRGGNVQAGLAQYDESLLSTLINQQYARLGGLSQQGLSAGNALAGVGTSVGEGNSIDINASGAADAGAALGRGRAQVGGVNGAVNAAGIYMGGSNTTTTPPPAINPNSGSFGGGPAFA